MELTPVETSIEDVTVYLDRARITRRGTIQLPAGSHRLALSDLPTSLHPDSVRASAKSTVAARLSGTEVAKTYHTLAPEADVASAETRVEALTDRDSDLGKELAAHTIRRTFLQNLATSAGEQLARGIALGRANVSAGAELGAFLQTEFAEIDRQIGILERTRREVRKELEVALRQREALQRRPQLQRHRVAVTVELQEEGELILEVSYQVDGASWQPLYDLRFTEREQGGALALTYLAQVSQKSGEAWDNVQLTLSTAKPALSSKLPELKPWFVKRREPDPEYVVAVGASFAPAAAAPMQRARAKRAYLEESTDDFEKAEAVPEPVEAEVETAEVVSEGAAVSFRAPGRPSIPGDGSDRKVTLGFHEFPARFDFVTAPKLVPQAFRRARATNNGKALLLPGPAQVFFGEEFVGSTPLKNTPPGGELEVFLGVDDRIKVERKLVQGSVDKKWMQDVRRQTYAYEIKIANLTGRRQVVTVRDQTPVPRHEAVKVKRQDVTPAPAEETEMGLLRWELPLEAGAERLIRFGFTLESPRDLELTGLPPLTDGSP